MAMKTLSDTSDALRYEVHEIRVEMHRTIDLLTRQVAETLLLLAEALRASRPVVSAAAASTSPRSSTPLSHVQSGTQPVAATQQPTSVWSAYALSQSQGSAPVVTGAWDVPTPTIASLQTGSQPLAGACAMLAPPNAPWQSGAAASDESDSRADDGWLWSYEGGWVFTPPQ